MAYPSILVTAVLSDTYREARWSRHVYAVAGSHGAWRGASDGGQRDFADFADEAAARADIAQTLRRWADEIERLPLRST